MSALKEKFLPVEGANLNVVELADGDIEGTAWPLIPNGIYLAQYVKHVCIEMACFKGAPKVFVQFRIVDPGEHFGKILYRAYRVKAIRSDGRKSGSPIVGGRFIVGRRSELLKDYCQAMETRSRPDRISLRALKHLIVKIRTRTVIRDGKQKSLPPALHYSVVDEIICKEVGG